MLTAPVYLTGYFHSVLTTADIFVFLSPFVVASVNLSCSVSDRSWRLQGRCCETFQGRSIRLRG